MKGQPGFFDLDYRYEQLSKFGDPLEKLSEAVNFEAFRYRLVKALNRSLTRNIGYCPGRT
ncbi:MAG: hypothetical protein ACE5EM_04200 [Sphingomonadales bacterium]